MNKILIMVVMIICIGLYYVLSQEKVWLLINKDDAEMYANTMLSKGDVSKLPNGLIDYVIVSGDDYVLFSEHGNGNVIYGYFPGKKPDEHVHDTGVKSWDRIDEQWFIGKVNN